MKNLFKNTMKLSKKISNNFQKFPKSSKFQPFSALKTKEEEKIKSPLPKDNKRSSLTRIEMKIGLEEFMSSYEKENGKIDYFSKAWIFPSNFLNQ